MRTGPRPLVVLVPGLGLDARAWRWVWPLLRGPSTVLTLPSMGRRAPTGADLGVPVLARELASMLPEPAGPAEPAGLVLVGHSASCQVVVAAAAHLPGVRGLVLVGPTTDPEAAAWPRMIARWVRTARHERAWEPTVLAPQYARTGIGSMVRGMDRVREHRVDLALASLPAPVQVVRGEHDVIADARWCDLLARRGGGTLTTVAGAAHMVPLTHPGAVADAVAAVTG